MFIGLCRIASQFVEPKHPNIPVRQNRLKTVLIRPRPMADIRIVLSDKTIAQLPTPKDGVVSPVMV